MCQKRTFHYLFDHFVGAIEQRTQYVETKRPGSLEIDHEFEFHGLLDRQIGRLCSIQNLLDIARQTFGLENPTRPVRQQSTAVHELAPRSNHGEATFLAILSDSVSNNAGQSRRDDEQAIGASRTRREQRRIEIGGAVYWVGC